MDNDSNPRVLLNPDTLPLLPKFFPGREEESNSDQLSTVDIAALNEPLLTGADSNFQMGNTWRSAGTPRRKEKPVETSNKVDKPVSNGLLKPPCQSEESQESEASNSDSDSDSEGSKSSSSSTTSSGSSSSCSSSSSDSDDSNSDDESASSQSSKATSKDFNSRPRAAESIVQSSLLVNGDSYDHSKPTSTKYHHRPKLKGYASSSDSRSSREKKMKSKGKHKNFSVSKTNYESGGLRLRIAALKPPSTTPNENYLCASPVKLSSSRWLSEESSNETKPLPLEKHKPSKLTKSSTSPVPEVASHLSSSPQKKGANPPNGSDKKKYSSIPSVNTPKSTSPSTAIYSQSSKLSTKHSSCRTSKSTGSPEKSKNIIVRSPEPDKPKKKSKLSCLMTSISPKSRIKTSTTTNGTPPLVNGKSGNDIRKDFTSVSQEYYQNHEPLQSPRKNQPSPTKGKSMNFSETRPGEYCRTSTNEVNSNNSINCYAPHPHAPSNSGQIIIPVKTKAAKKYIPDDHLVMPPSIVITPATPEVSTKKTNTITAHSPNKANIINSRKSKKKAKKKSSSKGKAHKEKIKKKNHKKLPLEPEGYNEICEGVTEINLCSGKTSEQFLKPKDPFTFELRKFTKFEGQTVIPDFPITRNINSFPKSPIASSSVSTGSGRKRKLHIVNDKMKEVVQSALLQRLPLKKRHHHTSSVDKNSFAGIFSTEQKCGDVGSFTKTCFDISIPASNSPVFKHSGKWKFNDFKDLVSTRSPSKAAATHSTNEKHSNSSLKTATTGRSTKKSKTLSVKTKKSTKKKMHNISPDITTVLVLTENTRRSGRIRKPRKLDLEDPPENLPPRPSLSPQKSPSKKENKKVQLDPNLVDPSVPAVGDSSLILNSNTDKIANVKVTSRKRTISDISPLEKPAIKKPKLASTDQVDVEANLNESEISTEVETDVENFGQSPPSSSTTTPITSPPQQPKKRRKVNKTGFPSIRKKKKTVVNKSLESDAVMDCDSIETSMVKPETATALESFSIADSKTESGKEISLVVKSEDPSLPSPLPIAVPKKSHSSKSGSRFSLTLSERVKMRKRNSIDEQQGDCGPDRRQYPGLISDLVDPPNPPVVHPVKNNYLNCGLLSNYFKTDGQSEGIRSNLEANNTLLPMPPDPESGEFTTTIIREYKLPYDIWCIGVFRAKSMNEIYEADRREFLEAKAAAAAAEATAKEEEAKLEKQRLKRENAAANTVVTRPKKAKLPDVLPPSWSFKKIRSNSYFGYPKPPTSTEFEQSCLCPDGPNKCATDDCLNRVVYTECPASCGDHCRNHRIQKHEWAPGIKRTLTETKGYGVFTREKIKKDDFILEYVGEVVPDNVFKERMHTIYATDTHHYCLHLDGGLVIDGHRAGDEGRFVNHSCEPNCEMQKWSVNGLSRMALFARRDIEPNEELSYDYNFTLFNPSEGQPCFCGSKNCRGIIGIRNKNGRNGDANGISKRVGMAMTKDSKGSLESGVVEKMKHLTKKDKSFVLTHNCFLIRNYEKIRKMRHEQEDKANIGDKLEKIMTAWTTRYKAGSSKNKPPQVPEEDSKLSRLARISQIFYELFINLTTAKDKSGLLLCQPFMKVPSKRKHSQLHADEPLDLAQIGKRILRGEYKTLNSFETDLGTVISSFESALEKDKPEISGIIQNIKDVYKTLKLKAVDELEPFIVQKGSKTSTISNELPNFKEIPVSPEVGDIIRCICERFSDEGMMVQCDKCRVWQHCDCMRVPYSEDKRKNQSRRNKFFSPVKITANTLPVLNDEHHSFPPHTTSYCSSALSSPSLSTRPNRPLSTREEEVLMDDILLNVKDEIPMLKEDSNPGEENSATEANQGMSNSVDFSDMETQRIDVDGDLEVNRPPPEMLTSKENQICKIEANSENEQPYYCELCDPRPVDKEVPLNREDEANSEKVNFTTLVREDGFMIRKNDTVYVLRDPPTVPGTTATIERPTYRTAGPLVPKDCDIFRVECLWKDKEGKRMMFGHHYVRPSETYHEHNRRFFKNEICRSPASEAITIDLVHGRCWVLDPITYCKGRPVDCKEEHVYICEFRVDKSNRSFSKVGKTTHAVCMKAFAFRFFENKINITRNYHPHGAPSPDFKQKLGTSSSTAVNPEKGKPKKTDEKSRGGKSQTIFGRKLVKKKSEQKDRLRRILDSLQSKVPDFGKDGNRTDLSNLLGRKKPVKNLNMTL